MNQDSKIRARYFLLSFTLAFALISAFFFFLINVVHPRAPVVPEPRIIDEDDPWRPDKEDTLTVLFMGNGSRRDPPGIYILARFAPDQEKVFLTVLPPRTLVQNQGSIEPMDEVYAYGGPSYTLNCLADTLGMSIDRYVRMDVRSFAAAAAAVGTVEFELEKPLEIKQGGYQFRLEKGLQLLDGRKIAQLFQWDGYKEESERYRIIASISAAIVEQRRDIAASTVTDKIFERIINLVDTDISYVDYAVRKASGEYLANLNGPVVEIIDVSGAFGEKETYALSDTFSARLAMEYG